MTAEPSTAAPAGPDRFGRAKGSDHEGLALLVICFAQLMVVLDATIVNVALPAIQRGLHFSIANLVWVTTGYSLTYGGLLLFGGRTGDLFGRRRMFMVGIAIFAAASLLGGLAQDSLWLVLTRACQGVGAAIASPTALSLIATNFAEGAPRNRAMGVYAAVSGAGGAIGLLAGGLLVNYVSWRWVLFVNVPIGILVLIVTPMVLREADTIRGHLDVPGAVTVTAGMALLVYGLTHAASHGWTSSGTLGTLAVAAVLLVAFVIMETRRANPLMPLSIFADRNRSGTYLTMLLIGAALFSIFYFLTLFFQDVQHDSPLRTGLQFLPFAGMIGVSAQISSRLVARLGPRVLVPLGAAIGAGGLAWLSTVTAGSSYLGVLGPFLVIGFGMGTAFVPLTLGAVAGVAAHESGLASALLNTGQQIGGAIGLAALSTIAVTTIKSRLHTIAIVHHGVVTPHLVAVATVHGYSRSFLISAAIAAGAFLIAVAMIRVGRTSASVPAAGGPGLDGRSAEPGQPGFPWPSERSPAFGRRPNNHELTNQSDPRSRQ
ncbi:MAG: MFS transporter [Solirubrobacteraceae bacterium]